MPITDTDLIGAHNEDIEASRARIVKSGIWKRQRVVAITPAGDNIPAVVYISHVNLMFPPNNGMARIMPQAFEVGEAYSAAIQAILDHPELGNWEYILTLEHDNCPPTDGLLRLVEDMDVHPEFAAIGGLYWTKGEGGIPMIWGDVTDPVENFRPQPPVADQIVECCGVAMGFTLWRLDMFRDERLRKPWFKTTELCTQDLHFWKDARQYGYRCAVNCGIKTGHFDLEGKFGPPRTMW